ncbi:alpha/beta hydrolase [Actinoplanes sp. NPDC026670]|uniref:alpha/beta hydrolase n=1 Tax=Actinoplanes sp. NPDC026670 TaxID=3154700 RepID=UPI0033C56AE5
MPAAFASSAGFAEHLPPAGLNIRGTVVVVPGRGESPLSYARLGRRLAADAYHVRIVTAPPVQAGGLATALESLTAAITAATPDAVRPLVLTGSDTGAALLAALLATLSATIRPDAVVLAGLPGHDLRHEGSWDDELDARSHCPVHRGVLTDDTAVTRGALASPVPADLLDAAYGSASDVPHLLLTGEADPLADRDALTRLAKSLPTARLATVRGAHHDVLNDVSHRSVAAEIITFLEAVRDGFPPRPFLQTDSTTW